MSEKETWNYLRSVPLDVICEFLDEFHGITGIRAAVCGCSGEPIAACGQENPLCRERHGDDRLLSLCIACRKRAALMAVERGDVVFRRCHRGLVLTVMPVVACGVPESVIFFCGYRCEPEIMGGLEFLLEEDGFRLSGDALGAAPFAPHRRLREIMELFTLATRSMSETGLMYRGERQLLENRLRLMAEANAKLASEKRLSRELIGALMAGVGPQEEGETADIRVTLSGGRYTVTFASDRRDLSGDGVMDAGIGRLQLYTGGRFSGEPDGRSLVLHLPSEEGAGAGERPGTGAAGPDEHVAKAKLYIMDNLGASVSLASVSRALFLSEAYFSKLFKERTGSNFSEYLADLRIDRARFLLDNTSLSVSAISGMVGFKEPNSFSRLFRLRAGMSPSAYRRRRENAGPQH